MSIQFVGILPEVLSSEIPTFKVPFVPARAKLWLETANQLAVLIGSKPAYADKTLQGITTAAYLHFCFVRKKDYEKTRVILKIFGIDYFEESSENLYWIGVREETFTKVASLFSSDLATGDWYTEPLPIDNFTSTERLTFFNLFFSLQALNKLERRNNQQYDLRKIMVRMLDIMSQNLNSIEHLQEHNIQVSINIRALPVNIEEPTPTLLPHFLAQNAETSSMPATASDDKRNNKLESCPL